MKTTFAVLALFALPFAPRPAEACGGFFCSGQNIDQSGEKVLFVVEPGHVQAHIQIQFTGDAPDFSWVVPIQSVPTVSPGSDDVFTALMGATVPRYARDDRQVGSCWDYEADSGSDGDADADSDADGDADLTDEVTVISAGVAGPYDYQVIDSDDPQALQTWLGDNGYDVPENSLPIISAYVESGFHFLGLKLAKGQDAGDLRPVVLDMDQDEACLPIRLTAIAATADMPITIWVLANEEAVSTNYPEVWMNDLWLYMQQNPDYATILNGALDEAGGRAFLVDYAGSPDVVDLMPDRYDTARLRGLSDAQAFMTEIEAQGLNLHPLMAGLLAQYMPVPPSLAAEGVTQEEFQQCIECSDPCGGYYDYYCTNACERCYGDELAGLGYSFDAAAFADAIEEQIAAPLRAAAEPFSRLPRLTRLYTTMSPTEMIEDPIFATNPDLPDVPNVRTGVRTYHCEGDTFYYEVTTPNGLRACYPDTWDFTPSDLPFALLAIQQSESGVGDLVVDNRAAVQAAYHCSSPNFDPGTIYVPFGRYGNSPRNPWNTGGATAHGGSLCSVTPAGGAGSALAIAGTLAALALRRRRR
jgi:hypothetical protein